MPEFNVACTGSWQLSRLNFVGGLHLTDTPKTEIFRASEGVKASRGNPKPFSDLDLEVMGETPLDFQQLAALKDAFSESNLPFRVDVVDWAVTKETFRRIIDEACEVVWVRVEVKTS
jgi:predicted nucleotidyltransferase